MLKQSYATGLGRLTVNFTGGTQSTVSMWCSRKDANMSIRQLPLNGEITAIQWNGQKVSRNEVLSWAK